MGRHGGGSRSGGRRTSVRSSRGGSRSGSFTKASSKPFRGCYNRSYYHKGTYRRCYTNVDDFGASKFRLAGHLFLGIFMSICLLPLLLVVASEAVDTGEKINGNPERIVIQDTIDLLTPEEEQNTLELFHRVYEKSGMPVTLYTDDMEWKSQYRSIEVYAEELYYAMGIEEDAMIVLFTYDGTFEWVYDMYCGDDTIRCLSDITFETLLDNFQKGMAGQKLYDALEFSFGSIMDDLAETQVYPELLVTVFFIVFLYGVIVMLVFVPYTRERKAYRYFQEHPEELDHTPMAVKHECPSCGAPNTALAETCEYCGTVLKL